MLRHNDIWQAIDRLAADHGFSASGLARKAGLDPTTFNRSKRVARDGRPRWPSTESIAKVLEATGATFARFVSYIDASAGATPGARRIPAIGTAEAAAPDAFDAAGGPSGSGWDEISFPDLADPKAYALVVGGDGFPPLYRVGDTLVVSPGADLRRGDRAVVRATTGEIMVRQFIRRGGKKLELATFAASEPDQSVPVENVAFVHRIVWSSQ